MKMLLLSLLSLVAFNAMADSDYLDSARLYQCGGNVQLRQAPNGDLALKFSGNVNKSYCSKVRFVDVSSGRVIKGYEFEGTSYTLSNKMEKELGKDCAVEFQLTTASGYVVERKQVVLKWWACYASHRPQPSYPAPVLVPSKKSSPFSYQISGNGNCKIMLNGKYTNENTRSASVCSPLSGYSKGSYLQYLWSNNDNCKIMINGQYIRNTADFYCSTRH